MGWNPIKEAEKAAKKAIDKVLKPAVQAAQKAADKAIWKARKAAWAAVMTAKEEATDAVRTVEKEAEDAVKTVGREVEDGVRKVGKEVEDGLTEKVPALVEKAFEELAQAVTKEGLKAVQSVVKTTHTELEKLENGKPALVGAINNLGGKVEIGPITLAYANFYTRTELVAGVLDQYINHPPELRRGPIIDMVKALGPDTVDLGISVQVVALVVGSKELGVGGGLNDVSIELFAEIGDVILEKMGVPE